MKKQLRINKNFSRKTKNKRYKRSSIKNRMKEIRKNRILLLLPSRIKLFYNPKFLLSQRPESIEHFFKLFCERFIFDQNTSHMKLPKPYCLHLYVPLCFVDELINDENVLLLLHRRYYTSGDCLKGRFKGDCLEDLTFVFDHAQYQKISILPFILFSRDFYTISLKSKQQQNDIHEAVDSFNMRKNNNDANIEEIEQQSLLSHNKFTLPQFASRLIYFKKDPNYTDKVYIYSEIYTRRDLQYLITNMEIIVQKYIDNVLFLYFLLEFRITFSNEQKLDLEIWFRTTLESYISNSKENLKNKNLDCEVNLRTHGCCKIMKHFRSKTNKNNY